MSTKETLRLEKVPTINTFLLVSPSARERSQSEIDPARHYSEQREGRVPHTLFNLAVQLQIWLKVSNEYVIPCFLRLINQEKDSHSSDIQIMKILE